MFKNLWKLLPALVCLSLAAQDQFVAHVTREGGGFTTSIQIENDNVVPTAFTLQSYDQAGNPLPAYTGSIDGRTTRTATVAELFENSGQVSHFGVEGQVRVQVSYDYAAGNGSPASVAASPTVASAWRLHPGNWSLVFDGVAVVNAGPVPTDVWLAQKDLSGAILKTVRIAEALAPNAKQLYVIGSPDGSLFSRETPSYFEVNADTRLAVTALRGTLGREGEPGLLWANAAASRSQAQTTRDDKGVWFIEGGDLYDGMEAMGYAVAVDRLFQLAQFKLNARGRLAELFGSSVLVSDMFMRAIDYTEDEYAAIFAGLDRDSQIMFQGYLDGINRRTAQVLSDPNLTPFEVTALQVFNPTLQLSDVIDTWRMSDLMAAFTTTQRNFNPNGVTDVRQLENLGILQELQAQYGAETAAVMFNDLVFINDPDAQTMIPAEEAKRRATHTPPPPLLRADLPNLADAIQGFNSLLQGADQRVEELGAKAKFGSYAWVIAPQKSASGNPILYSGPQMGYNFPTLPVEGSIDVEGYKASGMSVPGIPGIVVGRTPHHAWSLQVGHAHQIDLYLEPASAVIETRTETIKVAGSQSREVTLSRTAHGPVITTLPGDLVVSWKYASWGREFNLGTGLKRLVTAETIPEFGEALEDIAISMHVCYADRDGNIAYWMTGRDPIRPEGEFRLPQGSVGTPLEYDATVVKTLPHAANPAQGYFGGWNNKSHPDYDNTYGFVGAYQDGIAHRAHVITEYLDTHDNLTFEEVRELALEIASTRSMMGGGNPWTFIGEAFREAVATDPTQARTDALALLADWDGHHLPGGREGWISSPDRAEAWTLMDRWSRIAVAMTFTDEFGEGNLPHIGALSNMFIQMITPDSALTPTYNWFANTDATAPQTQNDIILAALDQALAELGERPWGTGARTVITHFNPIFASLGTQPTSPWLNRSTYAQVVEFDATGPIRIESMFPLGESGFIYGNPANPLFDPNVFSMAPLYDTFTHRVFPLFD